MSYNFLNIKPKESILFEYLKLILIAQVVIGHAVALSIPKLDLIEAKSLESLLIIFFRFAFCFGRESAYIFIFLSGFFTANTFYKKGKNFDFVNANVKRFFRALPILILALFLTLILDYLGAIHYSFKIYSINQMDYKVLDYFKIELFVGNFFSLQPTFCKTFGSNGPLWTLGYLMQFFFISALFKYIYINNGRIFSLIIILIFIIFSAVCNIEFILLYAVWLAGLICRRIEVIEIKLNFVLLIFFTVIFLIASKFANKYIAMIVTPITSIFILLLLKEVSIRFNIAKISVLSHLPDLSFAIYAFHMPVLFFTIGFIQHITGGDFINYYISVILAFTLCIFVSIFLLKLSTSRFFGKWQAH